LAPRCHFERYLLNEHINSMLTLANFCVERGVLPADAPFEPGVTDQLLRIIAPEDTLSAALRLARVCLCFDWQGEKGQLSEEEQDSAMLLLPIRRSRFSSEQEIEKWFKNNEWVRVYQFLFREAHSFELRTEALELMGDLGRAHIKFFKSKINYRLHLESLVYNFSAVLEELEVCRSLRETVELALALGRNLNKLLGPASRSVLF
jgi:hypothetical protein